MALTVHFLVLSLLFSYSKADYLGDYCNKNTADPKLLSNIDHLLSSIIPNFPTSFFITTSYGEGATRIFGLAQCRGDVGPNDCLSCIQDATRQIRKVCPNQSDARVWYDYCFFRYSQKEFSGHVDTSYGILYANVENVTDPEKFDEDLGSLFDGIDSQAVEPSSHGLGKGQKKLNPLETLYALVQCTRDLSPLYCAQCLAISLQNFKGFCSHKKGCRVLYSSCYVRYELYPFFFPLDKSGNRSTTLKTLVKKVHP